MDCRLDEERGDQGMLIVDFAGSGISRAQMVSLGKDLESRGYCFREKKNPWLGQTTYTGRAAEKNSIMLSLPMPQDRVAVNENKPECAYSFAGA